MKKGITRNENKTQKTPINITSLSASIQGNKNIEEVARQRIVMAKATLQESKEESFLLQYELIKACIANYVATMTEHDAVTGKPSQLTHFVNRNGIYLNAKHYNAVQKFNDANDELARVFHKSIMENKNGEHNNIVGEATIKNIKDLSRYAGK